MHVIIVHIVVGRIVVVAVIIDRRFIIVVSAARDVDMIIVMCIVVNGVATAVRIIDMMIAIGADVVDSCVMLLL